MQDRRDFAVDYQSVNAAAIDRWAAEDWKWGRPISREGYERAQRGVWDVLLTPSPFDPLANPEQMARPGEAPPGRIYFGPVPPGWPQIA